MFISRNVTLQGWVGGNALHERQRTVEVLVLKLISEKLDLGIALSFAMTVQSPVICLRFGRVDNLGIYIRRGDAFHSTVRSATWFALCDNIN